MVKWFPFQGKTKHLLCLERIEIGSSDTLHPRVSEELMARNQWSWVLSKCRKTQMTEKSWCASVMKGCN